MSYVKVFGSILDSSVWQTELHVRIVWVTLLALKDCDGHVEMSVPGLARRAGVSIEQVQEALTLFLSPDPHSTTPDNEGRRIEVIEDGWRVLNHVKYQLKENAADRKAKKAARQARWRANVSERDNADLDEAVDAKTSTQRLQASTVDGGRRDETPVDARSPHTDTDTDLNRASVPDLRSSGSGAARSEPRLERVQAPPPLAPDVSTNYGRVKLFVQLANAARARVAARHKIELRPLDDVNIGRQGSELLARLRDSSSPEADLEHVVAVAEAEAAVDVEQSRWLGWSIAEEKSWRTKLAAAPPPKKRPRPAQLEPKPVVVDDADREEARAAAAEWAKSRYGK